MNIILILLGFSLASAGNHNPKNTWSRVVVAGKDILNHTSAGSRVSDPFGNRTKEFLGLCDAEILAQRDRANRRFIDIYGIDVLGTGTYNAVTDQWLVPGVGVMITYANGDDLTYRLISDSWNDKVEKDNAHIMYHWGYLFQFAFGNGTFPGGKLAGKPYARNIVIGGTQVVWLDLKKRKHWNNPHKCDWKCRDTNIGGSERPAHQIVNSEGITDTFDVSELVNQRTNMVGFLASHVTGRFLDDNVTTIQRTRNIVTIGGTMEFKLPY